MGEQTMTLDVVEASRDTFVCLLKFGLGWKIRHGCRDGYGSADVGLVNWIADPIRFSVNGDSMLRYGENGS